MALATIPEALADLRAGKMIVVVDDPDRENEGDFIMAGEACTPEAMNFMVTHGRGVPFIATTAERFEQLDIRMMARQNTSRHGTAMGETVDALEGATTGVSAHDRAATVRVFCDPNAKPDDLGRPGHMLVIRAEDGGVLARQGHTEASVELVRLAGFRPVALGCEILAEDGTMMRMPRLLDVAAGYGLRVVSIADLVEYLRSNQ